MGPRHSATAWVASVAYLCAGLAWIAFSDALGETLFGHGPALARFQHYKGAAFVVASALFVYVLLRSRVRLLADARVPQPSRGPRFSLGLMLTVLVSATVLPLVVLLADGVRRQTDEALQSANALVRGTAESVATDVQQHLELKGRLIKAITASGGLSTLCDALAGPLTTVDPGVRLILASTSGGNPACRWGDDRAQEVPPLAAGDEGFSIGEPFRARGGEWLVSFGFVDGQGRVQVVARVDELVSKVRAQLPEGGVTTLVSGQGVIVARHPEAGFIGTRVPDEGVFRALRSGRITRATSSDGVQRVLAARAIRGTELTVFAGVPAESVYGPARALAWRATGTAALVLLASGLLIAFMVRHIASPMRALARAAERVGAGDFDARAPEAGADEVQKVASEFNRMAQALPQLQRQLQQQAMVREAEQRELLERRVEERTRELELSKEALESFSYSAAHDLRAPVAAIAGFAGALASRLAANDFQRAQHLADRIRVNAGKMDLLIDGMLTLAKSARPLDERRFSSSDIVAAVVSELAVPVNVEVRIATPLPALRGDPVMMRQVFWNLLSNAVKFSGQRAGGLVEVSCAVGEEVVFEVRDNGTGFDPAYVDKLFVPFQRLHSADFEGSGVGLSIVRRVVERHGGRVWAESAPGEGAVFRFALPRSRLAD